jgi:hypothetical protein
LIAGKSSSSIVSRDIVAVELRRRTSTSPSLNAVNRSRALSGVKRTRVASPNTAAAMARQ